MKNLLYKELKLAVHPTMWLFLLLSAMLLIPSYPYYVAFLYACLSIFFTFLSGRENRDVFYTVLLPIRKRDAVTARYLTISLYELAMVVISLPFAILSVRINPQGGNSAGIEPNVAFYGLVFVMLAGFNLIFPTSFYRTAHKIGRGLIWSSVYIFLFIAVAESLAQYIPSPISAFLDTTDPAMMVKHLPILIGGLVIWVGATLLSHAISVRQFEKVDL